MHKSNFPKMDVALPYRVAVYNTAGEHAESNMMYLTGGTPVPPGECAPPLEAGMLFRMNAHLNSGQILTSNEVSIALMP
ncbi:MAG: hypothetical protein AUJ92_14520 [Armatimonadetes bacterium CG2_30_59_28]|nr:hypothetical protein [Armatimonadota bacterium]OIO92274.1 MAG: hypothetical protein AUJ92_14520 [Armatimonadetes bacterium CG2_30_59_28]PIU65321.1 MAG: hypothetical protein COS85_09390 [Armatimonadetes bacterium CG07_land_8_20_14_0_80_59_28]PIX44537.1 MAG: hypothetical protein COZ56_04350 [Armatimonadetes bacterium CG_4_8_14_3_um_filter_58_9]PIY40676.1 MAG: hypothetical protein COZ05_17145 [Armatimonadetes bacterium CG_4_10_14_3_um_filter_59_10]PJB62188.1 MAG: hypothetical protein CO095_190